MECPGSWGELGSAFDDESIEITIAVLEELLEIEKIKAEERKAARDAKSAESTAGEAEAEDLPSL